MSYIRTLLSLCMVIFFANYLLPGVDVINQTKLPHIGGDLILALGLGILNFCILPLVRFGRKPFGLFRTAIATLILNFGVYAVLKLLPLGVFTTSVDGYLLVASAVSVGCCIIIYTQGKRGTRKEHPIAHHEHSESEEE